MAKSATCLWCGEEIQLHFLEWYHELENGPDRHIFCRCRCAEGDPEGGDTVRACVDGEPATPDLMTIKEICNQ